MERLTVIALQQAYGGKIIVTETVEGVFVNNAIVGNSKFKSFADKNHIKYKYQGGDNYQIIF